MTGPMPRPEVLKVSPYVGGEADVPGVNRVFKLSSNEGAFGPPPDAQRALIEAAAEVHRYPDGESRLLRQAIGRRYGLDPARIICGNGSDEIIAQLCIAYAGAGREVLMSEHGFLMYAIAGTWSGSCVVKAPERDLTTDVDALLAHVSPATRLVLLANPNNPTGSYLPQEEMARLRAGLPDEALLVIDAAYAEYVERPDYDPGVKLVDAGNNTVMTRTFSKVFGLGGMRVGWAYAPASVIDVLNRVRGPFNVSAVAQAAAIAALGEAGWVEKCRAHNTAQRARLAEGLRRAGIKVWPTEANFLLADFGTPERAKAADAHLRRGGLIVRPVGAYGLPHCLRITVGTEEEVGLVIENLTRFMAAANG
ncbi:MAG TPA: histidinol-phosphate transaminase [Acetobacteraceae bacterium]|nr:histidinol-phosphate transaminase [Acetobacteraceae bacterium]